MIKQNLCKRCDHSSFQTQSSKLEFAERRSFIMKGATPRYAPDRPFKLEHILLDINVDPVAKTLSGTVTQRLLVIAPDQTFLKLDQIGLRIDGVRVTKEGAKKPKSAQKGSKEGGPIKTKFSVGSSDLLVHLPEVYAPGQTIKCAIDYHVDRPSRGIYFTGPDPDYPSKPYQVWTQGQDEDSRYWFPTLDYPNQKATSEVIATVPPGYTAVSNGALIEHQTSKKGGRFHYRLGTPHVTYLMTLTVAQYTEINVKGPRGLPIQYFVSPGREEDGQRAFGNTPLMIEAFEKKLGVHYPYEKYSQVAVQDFIFGGMENTSATTQTDLTLHDVRAHLDFSSDPLVSHELAHQWFGDLVTCRDWSHGWLNEGFATFMERVWVEESTGRNSGFDEAKYYSYQDLKEHLQEDRSHYRRSIVCNQYVSPVHLFDTHLYQKGGLVLNLIRYLLGPELFWKSVRLYLTRHRGQTVETVDLIRAIEDATGRNLRQVFDEWIFSAGYPEIEVSYQWHETKKLTEWTIEQKQTEGQPALVKNGFTTPVFHLPVVLELTLNNGQKVTHVVELKEVRERVFLACPGRPVMARFDPDFYIPKTLKFPRPKEMLLYQLKKDSDVMGRIEAAQELSKIADPEVIYALGDAAAHDPFWAVQVEAAKVLGEIRLDASRDALIKALKTRHPKARRGVVNALGTFRDKAAAEALRKRAEKDDSYFVEAEAVYAWTLAKSKSELLKPVVPSEVEAIQTFLIHKLEKPSYRDVISSAALKGLAELPQIGEGKRSDVLGVLIDSTRRGGSSDYRNAGVRALGKVLQIAELPVQTKILEWFTILAEEPNFRLRMQLIPVLESSGCRGAVPILARIELADTDGRIRRSAQLAIETLTSSHEIPASVSQLRVSLEKLEEDYRKLRGMVEEQSVRKTTS